jgi:hypothetical protein
MSSKKTKTTSNETVGPSTFAQPYVQQALDQTKPTLDATQAIVGRYQPLLDKSRGYFDSVLSGDYLKEGNPYLNDVIDNSNQDITESAASLFSGAGRYGSAYHQGTLGREIGRNSSNLRYQDYANERGMQDSAAGRLPALAAAETSLAALPANIQADLIAQLTGRYLTSNGTSTSKSSGGLLGGILGSALSIAGGKI